MEEILCTMLLWLATQLITYLSKKTKLSQTYVAVILSIIFWGLIYILNIYVDTNSIQVDKLLWYVWWVYSTSQVIFNACMKLWIIKK